MKVNQSDNRIPQPAPSINKPTNKDNPYRAGDHGDSAKAPVSGWRDFASVLDDVSGARKDSDGDDGGSLKDSKTAERAEREDETQRRESRDEGGERGAGGDALGQRGAVREAAATGETSARAILHIADLERIISAVRTQTLAGGQREVTLELKRSVLEGLRIKLTADEAGRVTAEFVAASERVRAQIDARSGELAEILRSRGVNLASLHTTVSADSSQQGREDASQDSSFNSIADARGAAAVDPASSDTEINADDAPTAQETGTTYRA